MSARICPSCGRSKPNRFYLCRRCWKQLPDDTQRALYRHDPYAVRRLSDLYKQIRAGVPLGEIQIADPTAPTLPTPVAEHSGPEVLRLAEVDPHSPIMQIFDATGESILTIHPDGRVTADQPDKMDEAAREFVQTATRLMQQTVMSISAVPAPRG